MKTYFKHGAWNAICDVCGFQFKSTDLKQRWDGLMACSKDWETRHPAELIREPRENPAVPWSRPDPDIAGRLVCNLGNSVAIPGTGVAGCAVAGRADFRG